MTAVNRKVKVQGLITLILLLSVLMYAHAQRINPVDTAQSLNKEEALINNYIRSYPNPTNGPLTIELGKNYDHVQLEVRSANGHVVQSEGYGKTSVIHLHLNGPAGLYFIKITGDNMRQRIYRATKK